ncbi:carbohydrate-binding protein, partial [Streptomyces sp. T-3]|nr:carbohydrate-binding protein [Streptomyces sp. T-3]
RQQPLPGDQGGGRGRGGGPNTKGLLIGAIAVVAVVVVGIGVALLTGDDKDKGNEADGGNSGTTTAGQSVKPSEDPSKPAEDVELPKDDAKALTLAGGTSTSDAIPGSKSGTYVQGLNTVGASATWTVNGIPKDGKYTLKVYYGVPGKKMSTTLSINGKMQDRKLNMDNFGKGPEGDWEKGWTNTGANIMLSKGTNTLKISCETGDTCDVNLDQVELVKGWAY